MVHSFKRRSCTLAGDRPHQVAVGQGCSAGRKRAWRGGGCPPGKLDTEEDRRRVLHPAGTRAPAGALPTAGAGRAGSEPDRSAAFTARRASLRRCRSSSSRSRRAARGSRCAHSRWACVSRSSVPFVRGPAPSPCCFPGRRGNHAARKYRRRGDRRRKAGICKKVTILVDISHDLRVCQPRGRAGGASAPAAPSIASGPRGRGTTASGAVILSGTAASITCHRVIASATAASRVTATAKRRCGDAGERPEPPPVQSTNTSASVAADRMRTVQRSICSMDAVAMRCST